MKRLGRLVPDWGRWRTALAPLAAILVVLVQTGVPGLILADDADTLGNPDLEFSSLPPPSPLLFGPGSARLAPRGLLPNASLRQLVSRGPVRPRPPPIA